jgi:hypothetical protein
VVRENRVCTHSTVSPRRLALSFLQVQWSQQVLLLPRIAARQLMALPALLALLRHRRPRPTLPCLVQDDGQALTHLRSGDRRGPFFPPELARRQVAADTKSGDGDGVLRLFILIGLCISVRRTHPKGASMHCDHSEWFSQRWHSHQLAAVNRRSLPTCRPNSVSSRWSSAAVA